MRSCPPHPERNGTEPVRAKPPTTADRRVARGTRSGPVPPSRRTEAGRWYGQSAPRVAVAPPVRACTRRSRRAGAPRLPSPPRSNREAPPELAAPPRFAHGPRRRAGREPCHRGQAAGRRRDNRRCRAVRSASWPAPSGGHGESQLVPQIVGERHGDAALGPTWGRIASMSATSSASPLLRM